MIEFIDSCDHIKIKIEDTEIGVIKNCDLFEVWSFECIDGMHGGISGNDFILIGQKLNELNGVSNEQS